MKKPTALLTNDDGIESLFLASLLSAMKASFEVIVVAPATEKSWVGRALSRNTTVSVSKYDGFDCRAWSIDGTPTDCVNIALGNLLTEKPDVVVSGINIGFNTTYNFILSSGTVAGAMEGASWGIPSLAVSLEVAPEHFETVRANKGYLPESRKKHLEVAAEKSAHMACKLMAEKPGPMEVHNLNFPRGVTTDTIVENCIPGGITLGSLFKRTERGDYRFHYRNAKPIRTSARTDWEVVKSGRISYSQLDFTKICEKPSEREWGL